MTDILDEYNRAMAVLNDLSAEYLTWAQGDLKKMEDIFLSAKSADFERKNQLIAQDLFRVAHDMKGQGATFGYELITDIGNHLCRYIEQFDNFEEKQMNDIQVHMAALRQILEKHLTGDGGALGMALKEQVEAL